MKVLVFGYGSMGKRRVRTLLDDGHEVGVYDPVRAPMDQCRCFATESLAFRWHPQAVVIATPAALHARLLFETGSPAGLGVPVLLEKPVALSVADYEAERELWPQEPLHVHVGYQLRFHPDIMAVKASLEGKIVRRAFLTLRCNRETWPGTDYADTLLECSHELDLACHLFGPVERLEFASEGFNGRVWVLLLVHVSGTRTTIHIDDQSDVYERGGFIEADTPVLSWSWSDSVPHIEQCYVDETRAWVRGVQRGHLDPLACDLARGLDLLTLCDHARINSDGTKSVPSLK